MRDSFFHALSFSPHRRGSTDINAMIPHSAAKPHSFGRVLQFWLSHQSYLRPVVLFFVRPTSESLYNCPVMFPITTAAPITTHVCLVPQAVGHKRYTWRAKSYLGGWNQLVGWSSTHLRPYLMNFICFSGSVWRRSLL